MSHLHLKFSVLRQAPWDTIVTALPYDDDEGLAEACRSDAEMDNDPSIGLTTEQLRESLGR